jgi:hypothetical protein
MSIRFCTHVGLRAQAFRPRWSDHTADILCFFNTCCVCDFILCTASGQYRSSKVGRERTRAASDRGQAVLKCLWRSTNAHAPHSVVVSVFLFLAALRSNGLFSSIRSL